MSLIVSESFNSFLQPNQIKGNIGRAISIANCQKKSFFIKIVKGDKGKKINKIQSV